MAQAIDPALAKAQANVAQIGQQLRKQEAPLDELISLSDKMLQELRTGDLSPRQYYELNLRVLEELRYVQMWIVDLEKKNKVKMVDLYQRVQYVSSVVPRLYLMCTVGAAYCSLSGAPAKEVMKDMLEFCKCIQHPMRGLFLRNYLSTITRDTVALLGGPRERCEFVLQNFSEMTRLWVRMQPPKRRVVDPSEPPEDPKDAQKRQDQQSKREVERKQLCQLIGVNLHRLSEALPNVELYEQLVLPRVLDILVSSGDAFAQTYLSDVLCQVVPNHYQLATLETFLKTVCGEEMAPGMDVLQVLSAQMDRLGDEITAKPEEGAGGKAEEEIEHLSGAKEDVAARVFDLYFSNIRALCSPETVLSFKDQLGLHVALLRFHSRVDGKRLDRVDQILGSIADALGAESSTSEVANKTQRRLDQVEEKSIAELLRAPLENPAGDALGVLQLSRFPRLLSFLGPDNRRSVAMKLLKAVAMSSDRVEDKDTLDRLFDLLGPLLTSEGETDEDTRCDALVARIVHKLHHEDPNALFDLLCTARKRLETVPTETRRARMLIPLCFRNIQLVRLRGLSDTRAPLQEVYSVCCSLGESAESVSVKETASRCLVYAGMAADAKGEENVAYECLVQAFTLYESLADSKTQAALVPFLVGAVQGLKSLGKDNMDVVQARTALYAAQLLRKPDQARHVALSAHLFWSTSPERQLREGETPPVPGKNSKRALECLQRALKTVDAMQQGPANKSQAVALFVEILNQYVYMYGAGADKIKPSYITELIALIKEHVQSSSSPIDPAVEAFFRRTMAHIRRLAAKGGRFAEFAASAGVDPAQALASSVMTPVNPDQSL